MQAVQIGDPITQKRMMDMLLEARDRLLYRAITDNGAGGLSSSVGEMARLAGGCELDLSRVPLKYAGLAPWEILVSEAQERMTLAVPPENLEAYLALSARRRVESTPLGRFTADGLLRVRHGERTVALLDMEFLHRGDPPYELEARFLRKRFEEPEVDIRDHGQALRAMLRRLNLCSREEKCRQYDHEVKGRTVIKPFVGERYDVPSDASVLLAGHGGLEGIVLAEGVNPFYSDIDTYWMAASVVDEAVRRVVAAGGDLDYLAGLDNFCWPNVVKESMPERAHKLAQLVRANEGLYDFCRAYGMPLISGKDSMSNDSTLTDPPISIPPTLLVSVVSRIADVRRAVTLDPKAAGDLLYVLGRTEEELGGSELYRWYGERRSGAGPTWATGCRGWTPGGRCRSTARWGGRCAGDWCAPRTPRGSAAWPPRWPAWLSPAASGWRRTCAACRGARPGTRPGCTRSPTAASWSPWPRKRPEGSKSCSTGCPSPAWGGCARTTAWRSRVRPAG